MVMFKSEVVIDNGWVAQGCPVNGASLNPIRQTAHKP